MEELKRIVSVFLQDFCVAKCRKAYKQNNFNYLGSTWEKAWYKLGKKLMMMENENFFVKKSRT